MAMIAAEEIAEAVVKNRGLYMKKITIFLCMIFAGRASAGNWQYWSENTAAHKISDKESIGLGYYSYFSEVIGDSYFQFTTINYSNRFYKGLGAYGEIYSESLRKTGNTWKGSSYIVPGIFYDMQLGNTISLRLMDRFYYFTTTPSCFDYHRPRVSLTLKQGNNTFSLSDEMRMDLTGSRSYGFYRNRFFISASRKVSRPLTLGLSWVIQADRSAAGWKSVNILQSTFKVDF